jgi:outer membrane receptor protein involved in Fe transport
MVGNQIGVVRERGGRQARLLATTAFSLFIALGMASAADAQEAAAPADGIAVPAEAASDQTSGATVADIVVTGSRVSAAGFNAPTPLTVVSGESLDRFQATNLSDVLARLPAVKATFNPGSTGFRTQFPGANFIDLYGLGANRTLVLVNGTRVVPQAPAASAGSVIAVDMNLIPSLMVDHVDVVTGGASAQWGSDAIAGVVNVFLRTKYEGIQVKAQSGLSERGDNANYRLGAMAGTNFADGRGNIIAGIDWSKNSGLGDVYTRDWSRKLINIVANPNFATNGQPANVILPNVVARSTPTGVIVGPANFSLNNFQILPNGAIAPFQVGQFPGALSMAGGDPNSPSFIKNNNLSNPYSRVNSYARAEFEFSPALTLFADGMYGVIKGMNIVNPPRALSQPINIQNGYLPQQIVDAMTASRITSFSLNRQNYDLTGTTELANGVASGLMKVSRWVVGAKGDLGNSWNWDLQYTSGKSDYRNRTRNNLDRAKFNFSVDSVRLANGTVVCRATQPGPAFNAAAAGCVPVNLFGGAGSPSLAAAQYYLNTVDQFSDYTQKDAAINLRGQPFETWAGPVSIAMGAEYRREKHVVRVDPISDAGGYLLNNATNLRGRFDVKEGYFEAVVPLARDMVLAQALDLDVAVRYADYSSIGTATTWKVGANYEPIDGLRFRATRSRDLRAPAIFELGGKGSVNQNTVTLNGFTRNIATNVSIGNPSLRAEKGDTLTLGAVFQPRFAPGLRMSLDHYGVKLSDTIVSVNSQNAATLCQARDAFFCSLFTFDAAGAPTALTSPVLNAGFVDIRGFDAVVSYRTKAGPGTLSLDFDITYLKSIKVNLGAGSPTIDRAGENGGNNNFAQPRSKFTASATYAIGPATLTGRADFIAKGTIDNSYNTAPSNTITSNRVPAVVYVSTYGSVDVTDHLQLFGSIQNLLDKDPPVAPIPGLFQQTNGQYYDLVGRKFMFGISVKY